MSHTYPPLPTDTDPLTVVDWDAADFPERRIPLAVQVAMAILVTGVFLAALNRLGVL